ncbi:hypothetical protein DC74_4506 [Streptomyces noursei]|nr:hypothetical protein DC74_4506 [Streptomyces noursei]
MGPPYATGPPFTPASGPPVPGPARDRTREVNGPSTASTVTSAISPTTAQRTTLVRCPTATRCAVAQAAAGPRRAWSAAASAARSAAAPARCRAVTAWPTAINAAKTAHSAAAATTVHTVAEPASPHRFLRKGHRLSPDP